MTQLRKDPDFISADKYTGDVVMTGEVGKIANCRIVPSRKVKLANGAYTCPIVKLEQDGETEDELPALTIYLKRQVMVESDRKPRTATTEVTANEFYAVGLTNEAKVVLAKFAKTAPAPQA